MAARIKHCILELQTYYETIILRKGWATGCEIKAASEMLHRKINVWLKGMQTNLLRPNITLSQFVIADYKPFA